MKSIKWGLATWLCLLLTLLLGCLAKEYIYVKIIINDVNSPPIIKISSDRDFEKPAYIREIKVISDEKRRIYWSISPPPIRRLPIQEVIYNVVPDGFEESEEKLPLEPYAKYRLNVYGGAHGSANVDVNFIYKPGIYSGYGLVLKSFP